MANPARVPDPRTDPLNPAPPAGADPFTPGARNPANSSDPRVVNRIETRSGGSSVLIAAIVLVLAVIAYFVFAPGSDNAPVEPATTTTEPAAPAPDATAPAPDATAPAAPADPATPAPDATAPAAPADPAAPAPDAAAPAPAEPAPAQ
ncbi:hypothetical protein [Mesorhizobium sp. KR9-304]|uniref:hypothetical protein n=1 Tax=Mesorhizobium sp. KR9-304 TaxID=3156614 RepID=UPI0032B3E13C